MSAALALTLITVFIYYVSVRLSSVRKEKKTMWAQLHSTTTKVIGRLTAFSSEFWTLTFVFLNGTNV